MRPPAPTSDPRFRWRCCCWQPHQPSKRAWERHGHGGRECVSDWVSAWHMCEDKINGLTPIIAPRSGALAAQLLLSKRVLPWCSERAREHRNLSACHCRAHAIVIGQKVRHIWKLHAWPPARTQQAPLLWPARHSGERAALLTSSESERAEPKSALQQREYLSIWRLHSDSSYAHRRIRRIQFDFRLQSVRTCSEKPEATPECLDSKPSGKQSVNCCHWSRAFRFVSSSEKWKPSPKQTPFGQNNKSDSEQDSKFWNLLQTKSVNSTFWITIPVAFCGLPSSSASKRSY